MLPTARRAGVWRGGGGGGGREREREKEEGREGREREAERESFHRYIIEAIREDRQVWELYGFQEEMNPHMLPEGMNPYNVMLPEGMSQYHITDPGGWG